MKCKTVIDLRAPNPAGEHLPNVTLPAGSEIDKPDCYKLVQHGVAEPIDDECREFAGMTREQITAAQKAYVKVSKGIHPDDYAAFDAGQMVGYDGDGEWIPGPNYVPTEEEDDEDE